MSQKISGLPLPEHAAKYFGFYFKLIEDHEDLLKVLLQNREELKKFFYSIPAEKLDFAYAPEKWTIKEVLLHIIDTERIFQYRALRLGRNDATPLIGFDENAYAPFSFANHRSLDSIAEEWLAVRNCTIELFKNFQIENLDFIGQANGNPITARGIGWFLVGHAKHHQNVILERYI